MYKRFDISIAIPLDEKGDLPREVSDVWETLILPGILKLKDYAEDIPTDHGENEWTTRATMYDCGHPNESCSNLVEIKLGSKLKAEKEIAEI